MGNYGKLRKKKEPPRRPLRISIIFCIIPMSVAEVVHHAVDGGVELFEIFVGAGLNFEFHAVDEVAADICRGLTGLGGDFDDIANCGQAASGFRLAGGSNIAGGKLGLVCRDAGV